MALKASYHLKRLIFRFDAGTSRGVLKERKTYIIKLWNTDYPDSIAFGEAGPIVGLSPDPIPLENKIQAACSLLNEVPIPANREELNDLISEIIPTSIPSLRFAIETAFYDLFSGSEMKPFPGKFTEGSSSIPINGLVWMGSFQSMKKQVDEKIADGYRCIKIKIGAIDFHKECSLLAYVRGRYGEKISLRVDANGAFDEHNVYQRLEALSEFNIHSIEQPIRPGQPRKLKELCLRTPVPIALDEELIGVNNSQSRESLLEDIQPQYIVLKPTLLGGIEATSDWVRLAQSRKIKWWITSALESNVGLNALAQYASTFDNDLPQGLGTGQLYTNNSASKLLIEDGRLYYKA